MAGLSFANNILSKFGSKDASGITNAMWTKLKTDFKDNFGDYTKGAFNNTMSSLFGDKGDLKTKQTENNRFINQAKDLGGNFLNAATSSGGFNVGAGLKASAGGIAAIGGDLTAKWGQKVGNKKYGENITSEQNNVRSAIRQGIASFGPIGWAVAAGTGVVDAIGAATGTELSNIDKDAANRAGVRGTGFQNALNYLPGVSTIPGAIGNWMGIDRTSSFAMSDEAEEMAPGYSGTIADMQAAEKLGNKRFLLRKQANKAEGFVNDAIANNQILAQLNVTNIMRKESDYYKDLARQNANRYAGENYLSMRMGREGIKLPTVEEIRAIRTRKLQAGGVIGVDSNILPEGALHARLNHLYEVNPDLEDATKKGIPVMTADGEQIAEIEKEEIILRLEVTKKLEELMEDGSEEAMIEAGKLLATEIMENTQDNTGQITEEVSNE